MALVLKKLVSRSSSVAVPYLWRPPNHPRHFFSAVRSFFQEVTRDMIFEMPTKMAPEFARTVFYNRVPHTLGVTARVEGAEARYLRGGDMDVTLGTSMKFSLESPGIEKITETPENLYVSIDMGLPKNWVAADLDAYWSTTKLLDSVGPPNLLSIEGYVQKLDIRRHYTAVVPLPPHIIKVIKRFGGFGSFCDDFLIHHKNGGVVVTIPKHQHQLEITSTTSTSTN